MQTTTNERVLVRGSEQHKYYQKHEHGRTLETVDTIETKLAIWGRVILLSYVIYIPVRGFVGAYVDMSIGWVKWGLFVLDVLMLLLQIVGLEGSRPGLIHQARTMQDQNKLEAARDLLKASDKVRMLMVLAALEVVFEITPKPFGYDISSFVWIYSDILLVVRVWVVSTYLGKMADLSRDRPRIISQAEYDAQSEAEEQKQTRIDNGNVMTVFQQAIEAWAKKQPDMNAAFSQSIQQLELIVSQKIDSTQQMQNEKIEATQRLVEALQFGSTSANSAASVESILPQVEAQVSRLTGELRQSFESLQLEVKHQVKQAEAETSIQMRNLQSKVDKAASDAAASRIAASSAVKPAEKVIVERNASVQATPANVHPITRQSEAGLTKEEVIRLIEEDESLLRLSDAILGQKVGATKSTANRAKKEWYSTHPESLQQGEAAELDAVNS